MLNEKGLYMIVLKKLMLDEKDLYMIVKKFNVGRRRFIYACLKI